jgi:hypothetical protein
MRPGEALGREAELRVPPHGTGFAPEKLNVQGKIGTGDEHEDLLISAGRSCEAGLGLVIYRQMIILETS